MAANDFETNLHKLEELAGRMKSPEISLEESISCYEEGMKYYSDLKETLSKAERRIQTIEAQERKEQE